MFVDKITKQLQRTVLTVLSLLVLALLVVGADPGHLASSIDPDTFQAGNYTFNGNLTVGSPSRAHFFVDNSSGRVGIGNVTSKLNATLTVNGNMSVFGQLILNSGALEPEISFDTDRNTGIAGSGSDGISLWTGGSERLKADGNGNIHISGSFYPNTNDGNSYITGSTGNGVMTIYAAGTNAEYAQLNLKASKGTLRLESDDTNLNFSIVPSGYGDLFLQTDSNTFLGIGTTRPNRTLHISNVGSSNALVINDTTANIGVNTSTPTATLEVNSYADKYAINLSNTILINNSLAATSSEIMRTVVSPMPVTLNGNVSLQRFTVFEAPTITATDTMNVSDAATVYISGNPKVTGGANTSGSNALWVNGTTKLDGELNITGNISAKRGTERYPAYTFSRDNDTGMDNPSENQLSFGVGSQQRMLIVESGAGGLFSPYIDFLRSDGGSAVRIGINDGGGQRGLITATDTLQIANENTAIIFGQSNSRGMTSAAVYGHDTAAGNDLWTFNPGSSSAGTSEKSDLIMSAHTNTITGGYVQQRFTRFMAPTVTAATLLNITNVATVYIEGAPKNTSGANFTHANALWIDGGGARIRGNLTMYSQNGSNFTCDVSNTGTFTCSYGY